MARQNYNNNQNVWNVWARDGDFSGARNGYYTNEFAKNNPVAKYDNNQYHNHYGRRNNNQPGGSRGFSNQFQQQQPHVWGTNNFFYGNNYGHGNSGNRSQHRQQVHMIYWNQDRGGFQHRVVSYSYNNQGVVAVQKYSEDYNGNYQSAKRPRWERGENENRIAPYNRYNGGRTIRCYDCGQLFATYKALHEHKDAEHKRSFYCSICNKECPSHGILKKHELTHTINACQKCPETFKYKESLIAHEKHAHPVQPPALPAIAEDSGTEADQALAHQSNSSAPEHHSNEKIEKNEKSSFAEPAAASTPLAEKNNLTGSSDISDSGVKTEHFHCPHCIKSFDCEKKMYAHCKIHTEADPDAGGSSQTDKPQNKSVLACPFCIKKFTTKRDLTVHMSSVHTQTFYCLKCPAEFSSHNELTAHLKSHD